MLSKNIRRGVYAAKFSPRSTKFPPRLLGGKKFFAELLLTDCVRQGLKSVRANMTFVAFTTFMTFATLVPLCDPYDFYDFYDVCEYQALMYLY